MKKVISFFAATTFMLSIGLSSCVKEDPAKPIEIDWTKTGTVTGKLLYVNDPDAANPVYKAPSGNDIEIYATILYSAIAPGMGLSGSYVIPKEKISYKSGDYSIETPVGNTGGVVTVRVSSFFGSKKESGNIYEGYWHMGAFNTPTVIPGQTTIDLSDHFFSFTELIGDGSPYL